MARSALHRTCVSALALAIILLSVWLEASQAASTASTVNVSSTNNSTSASTTTPAASGNNGGANQNVNDDDATTTTKPSQPKGFFDSNNNKAMFIVLPAMVLVYGGCASIYCIHKLCKSYRRYKRRKQKQQMLAQMEQERLTEEPQVVEVGHTNAAYTGNTSSASASCSSMDMDVTAPGQTQGNAPGKAEKQPFKPFHKDGSRAFNVASPSGSSGSKDDIIRYKTKSYEEKEDYAVKNPGYHRQQEAEDPAMGLIDMQLKEALAMIDSVVRKPMEFKSRPDLEPKENENAEPIKRRRRMKKKVFVPQ